MSAIGGVDIKDMWPEASKHPWEATASRPKPEGKTIPPGSKWDSDKPRMDLLDPLALEGLAKVLTFGAKKYAAHNWRGGISYSRLLGAAMRHTFSIIRGEDIDPESGLPHVDHLGCCWMFLSNMMKTRQDLDDRYMAKANTSPDKFVERTTYG